MIYDEMCMDFNCEHYIEWEYEVYGGVQHPCISCKLVGLSYHIEEIPKECEYFKKVFLEQFLNDK